MTDLMQLGQQAKDSAQQLALMPTNRKNELLVQMAKTIKKNQQAIIEANQKDLEKAVENNISETMQDRLQLTPERINAMAAEIEKIASLDDHIGKVDEMWTNTDGLRIGKKRVPLGVIGIIYESRPNVTTSNQGMPLSFAVAKKHSSRTNYWSNYCSKYWSVLANLLMPSSLSMILHTKLQDS